MSKSFEEEYRALANREVPDLWARIEAGLTPKSTVFDNSPGEEVETEQRKEGGERKTKLLLFFGRYRGLAAAMVCGVILLPAVLLVNRIGSKNNFGVTMEAPAAIAEAPEMEAVSAEDADTGMTEEALADSDMGMIEEAAEEPDTEMPEEAEAADVSEADAADVAEGGIAELSQDAYARSAESDAKKEEAKGSMSAAQNMDAGSAEVLEKVLVRVLQSRGTDLTEGTETNSDLEGTIYTVEIMEDPSGTLAEGVQVQVGLSAFSAAYLQEGAVYRMRLQREENSAAFAYQIQECREEEN